MPVTRVSLAGAGRIAGKARPTEAPRAQAPWTQAPWAGADVLAVTVSGPLTRAVEHAYGVDLAVVAQREGATGKAGEVLRVPVPAATGLPGRLLLVGTGDGGPRDLRSAAAALARACRGRAMLATTLGAGDGASATRAVVEGLVLGGYAPPAAGTRRRADSAPVPHAALLGRHAPSALLAGAAHAGATVRARDLAATPSNIKTPSWFVERVLEGVERAGLDVEVWEEARLRAEGFGGLVAVAGGSAHAPRLVRLTYTPTSGTPTSGTPTSGTPAGATRSGAPSGRARRPIVLVGKGITFDTGGLSIKPREAMVAMKTDMTGAAVVLAALEACSALGVRRQVVGLMPLAENAVGAASYRPGDVVRQYGGTTVEVANTDAEGRLVLADALAYAAAHLSPAVLVDVATLTGAATLGLGRRHAALYSTHDGLAGALLAAAQASGEKAWRMPLVEDYLPAVRSDVADLRHVAADARISAGSVTAALFLREFVGSLPWAHLDIAGPARADKDEHEVTKGATGFGARLLLRWLEAMR